MESFVMIVSATYSAFDAGKALNSHPEPRLYGDKLVSSDYLIINGLDNWYWSSTTPAIEEGYVMVEFENLKVYIARKLVR